eukprot:TRINITY_DN16126_c0_g1_i1.p1 TRINITY_DN16126_c0_g1~~TRINITY_DN16126_c0_g1_i1.p1  ORF type:complete len:617 (+),score=112.32 TRINITY_DN16126_c0_g1_i1:67-1917(+)
MMAAEVAAAPPPLELLASTTSSFSAPGVSSAVSSPSSRRSLSWREGRFANWTVILGERRFKLHKYNLARGSTFFEAAMAEEYESSKTDLSLILARPCWPFFEDFLDALYGEDREAAEVRLKESQEGSDTDGVLSASSAVFLLATSDALGCQSLFERSLQYIDRRMSVCALAFWEAVTSLPRPLSGPLERVVAASRTGLLRGFERFLSVERATLLRLTPDILMELLEEDGLAVRAEVRLLEFVVEYGRHHGLFEISGGELHVRETYSSASHSERTRLGYRNRGLPPSRSSNDGAIVSPRGEWSAHRASSVDEYCDDAASCCAEEARMVDAESACSRHETADAAKEELLDASQRSELWKALCAGIRWGEVDLWQLEHLFRNPESGALTLRQEALPGFGGGNVINGIEKVIPEELIGFGLKYQVMKGAPTWAYERFMSSKLPMGLNLRPRRPVRPPHAPPLEPNQVEKFVHFEPHGDGNWRPGDAIDSPIARVGKLRFQLKLQPGGEVGEDNPEGGWAVAAYIRVVPEASWPRNWEFRDVEYSIYVVPWQEQPPQNATGCRMRDQFTFNGAGHNNNRGWHDFLTSRTPLMRERLREVLSPEGYLLVRAEVTAASALQGP